MTRATFVNLDPDLYDQHGVYSLIAVLKQAGVDVTYVAHYSLGRALSLVSGLKPDLVLYSSFSASLPRYAEFDRMYKATGQGVSVIGGPGPTYNSEYIRGTSIDAFCVGEGEEALAAFVRNGWKSCGNIVRRDDDCRAADFCSLSDLDRLPFPDRDVVYQSDSLLRGMPSKQFFSGRGCPFDCTYCFNHKFRELFKGCGPIVRKKGVDYLLEEISLVKKRYPLASVVFNDDLFILNKKWLMEFCDRYARDIGLPFTCNVRANLVDADVVRCLHEGGCRAVNWSIESGDADLRDNVLRRNMSEEQILQTAELLNRYGIKHRIGNLIGLPGEQYEQMLSTLDLNIRCKPTLAVANIFVPYPGLRLTQYAVERGYFTPVGESGLPRNYYERSVMNLPEDEKRRIYKLMCLFSLLVRYPGLFRNQRARQLLFSLPRPILRLIREIIYTLSMMRLYVVKTPFLQRCRLAWRYLRGL